MSSQNEKYEARREELKRQFRGQMIRVALIAAAVWLAVTVVAVLLRDSIGVFTVIVASFLTFVVAVVLAGQQIGSIKKRRDIQMELLGQDEPFKHFSVD